MPRSCRYTLDLNLREGHEGYNLLKKTPPPPGYKSLQQQLAKTSSSSSSSSSALLTASSSSNAAAVASSSSSVTAQLQLKQEQKKKNALLASKRKAAAMAIATKPVQAAAFNAFMLYMAGNQLNTFSISICSGAILSPLSAILNVPRTFAHLKSPMLDENGGGGTNAGAAGGDALQMPKLIFIALNLVWLAIGLYKMSTMRLLPTTSADWTHYIVWKEMMETTSIPPAPF